MDDVTFLSGGWRPAARVVFITAAGYVSLLLLLRVSGKRPLARMTAFDFVITVTLGSAFGRVVTATEVGIVEAVLGFAMLVLLQVGAAWLQERWKGMRDLLAEEAALLYHNGEFVRRAMRRHRIMEDDLLGVVRKNGLGSLEEATAVILERDGQFSVLTSEGYGDGSALEKLAP
jgi:uncharacterized membrane protein YcaP (DUF421 family)